MSLITVATTLPAAASGSDAHVGMLSLDHVSLVGPVQALVGVGLRLTPTPGDDHHARIHLDGSYLELRAGELPAALRGSGWFLRPADPSRIALTLAALDVDAADPTSFHGADGTWSDISVGGGALGAVAAVITHRVDRPDWPPRSGAAHPNGAVAVAESSSPRSRDFWAASARAPSPRMRLRVRPRQRSSRSARCGWP